LKSNVVVLKFAIFYDENKPRMIHATIKYLFEISAAIRLAETGIES